MPIRINNNIRKLLQKTSGITVQQKLSQFRLPKYIVDVSHNKISDNTEKCENHKEYYEINRNVVEILKRKYVFTEIYKKKKSKLRYNI